MGCKQPCAIWAFITLLGLNPFNGPLSYRNYMILLFVFFGSSPNTSYLLLYRDPFLIPQSDDYYC